MLTLCFIAVITLIATTAGGVYVNIKHHRESSIISKAFISYFCDPLEDGLTAFDKSLNNLAQITADKQATMIVASMRGTTSGALRSAESALEGEAVENIPEAAILAALPKKLQKNPLAQMGIMSILQKALAGGAGKPTPRPEAGGNHKPAQNQFDFKL